MPSDEQAPSSLTPESDAQSFYGLGVIGRAPHRYSFGWVRCTWLYQLFMPRQMAGADQQYVLSTSPPRCWLCLVLPGAGKWGQSRHSAFQDNCP